MRLKGEQVETFTQVKLSKMSQTHQILPRSISTTTDLFGSVFMSPKKCYAKRLREQEVKHSLDCIKIVQLIYNFPCIHSVGFQPQKLVILVPCEQTLTKAPKNMVIYLISSAAESRLIRNYNNPHILLFFGHFPLKGQRKLFRMINIWQELSLKVFC